MSFESSSEMSAKDRKNYYEKQPSQKETALKSKLFEALDADSGDIKEIEMEAVIPVEEGKYNWHDNFLELMWPRINKGKILDLFCGPNSIKEYFKNKKSKAEVIGLDIADNHADIKADVRDIEKFIKPEKQFDVIFELRSVPGYLNRRLIKDYLSDNGLYITSSSDEVFRKSIEPVIKNAGKNPENFFNSDELEQIKYFQPRAIVEVKNIKSYISNYLENEVYVIYRKRKELAQK